MKNKRTYLFYFFLCYSSLAYGKLDLSRLPSSPTIKPVLIAVDPGYDLRTFSKDKYRVFPNPAHSVGELPSPSQRNQLLKKAGFESQDLVGFRHLELDLLYMYCRHFPLEKVTQRFPQLSSSKLKNLKLLAAQK